MISNRIISSNTTTKKPDAISAGIIKQGFPDDMIISHRIDGEVNSIYRHDVWDLTPYSTTNTKFYFKSFGRHQFLPPETGSDVARSITNEIKRIIGCLMYAPELQSGMRNALRKPGTIKPYHKILKRIGCAAAGLGKTLSDVEADSNFFDYLVSSSIALRPEELGTMKALIVYLHRLVELDYESIPLIVPKEKLSPFLEHLGAIYSRKKLQREDANKRTFIIPSRIYANYIVGSLDFVKDNKAFVDAAFHFYEEFSKIPFLGVRDKKEFLAKIKKYGYPQSLYGEYSISKCIFISEAYKEYGLFNFDYHNADGEIIDINGIGILRRNDVKNKLSRIQSCCRLLLHAFTGMRSHEVYVIPSGSFEVHSISSGRKVPFIKSHTSKIDQDNYSKPTYWVTSWEVEDVVAVAEKIAKIASLLYGKKRFDNLPMFPSVWAERSDSENHPHFSVPLPCVLNYMVKDVNPLIKGVDIREEDIQELERFDMFSDWRSAKGIKVGAAWPVSSHQFRRSLAVYGAKSGLVSLPSLSVQFKHMTEVMSELYAENSSFAVSFLGNSTEGRNESQKSFAEDLIQMNRLVEALKFSNDVIDVEEKLMGGTGKIIQKLKDKDSMPTWLIDREETKQRFLEGRQSYRDTVLGGCTNPEPCDKAGLGGISPCPDCEYSIIGGDGGLKEKAYLESLELSLSFLQTGTPAYEAVVADIHRIRKLVGEE